MLSYVRLARQGFQMALTKRNTNGTSVTSVRMEADVLESPVVSTCAAVTDLL